MRKQTKKIKVKDVYIGGGEKIAVQSMTNTNTSDIEATVLQIKRLKEAGCDIVRLAIPDLAAAKAVYKIKESIDLPLVADIHFDYKLALECANAGIDKIRINPGNIGDKDRVHAVAQICALKNNTDKDRG
jgi:(E)-4-hydroxy-3-methylbut-2-enyl-diphosphate synthase